MSRSFTVSRSARRLATASGAAILWSLATAANALPQNPTVFEPTGGIGATFDTSTPGTLTVDQIDTRVVIDWDSFNIGSTENVVFNQGGPNWIAFNRVDPSQLTIIDGGLTATGSIWIFSPGGLIFGNNASVDVGSLVATTTRLLDGDAQTVLAGDSLVTLTAPASSGSVIEISENALITGNDFLVFFGENITQNGTVSTPSRGTILFGVGEAGSLSFTAVPGPSTPSMALSGWTVGGVPGRGRPTFIHGAGAETSSGGGVAVIVSDVAESGFGAVINMDGVVNAYGVVPGGAGGFVILSGDILAPPTDITVDTAGATIYASSHVMIEGSDVTVGEISTGETGDIIVTTYGDLAVTGDLSGADVYLTAFGSDSDLTISSRVDSTGYLMVDGDGDVTITGTAYLYADGGVSSGIFIRSNDGGVDIQAGAYVYAVNYADVDISSYDDLNIAGRVEGDDVWVDSVGSITVSGDLYAMGYMYVAANGDILVSGDIEATGINMFVGGALTVANNGDIDGGYAEGYSVDIDAGGVTVDAGGQIRGANDVSIDGLGAGSAIVINGEVRSNDNLYINSGGSITVGATGMVYGYDGVALVGELGVGSGDITIDGDVIGPNGVMISNRHGDVVIGASGIVTTYAYYGEGGVRLPRPGTALYGEDGDIFIYAYGSVTTEAGSQIYTSYNFGEDSGLLTIRAAGEGLAAGEASIDLNGDISAVEVVINAYNGDMLVGGNIIAYDHIDITHTPGDFGGGDIFISGDLAAGYGITVINQRGDVTLQSTAELDAGYYFEGGGGEVIGRSGGPAELGGLDGDIYIYAAGQLVTAAGSSIVSDPDGPGADSGLVTLVAGGSDGPGGPAMDLSGDIYGSDIVLNALDGSILQRGGAIEFRSSFIADAAGDFDQNAGAAITATPLSPDDYSVIDIFAQGDITLDGSSFAEDVFIESSGASGPTTITIGGTVEGDDMVHIINGNGDVSITGDIYAGLYSGYFGGTVFIRADGEVSSTGGSSIETSETGTVTIASIAPAGETGIQLGGDIDTGTVDIYTTGAGLYLTGGTITAVGDVDLSAGGGALQTLDPSVINASGDVFITTSGTILVSGDVTAYSVAIYLGADATTSHLSIDGTISSDTFIQVTNQNVGGHITLGSDGQLLANLAGGYSGTSISITAADGAVITQAGSIMRVGPSGGPVDGSISISAAENYVTLSAIDLSGDITAESLNLSGGGGDVYLRAGTIDLVDQFQAFLNGQFRVGSGAVLTSDSNIFVASNAGITVNGTLDAGGDISLSTQGMLTTGSTAELTAVGGVRLSSDDDMTIGGTITAEYLTASIYGGEGGGVDGALLRIEGDVYARDTIDIYNDVGDVELGASATLHGNTVLGSAGSYTFTIQITGEDIRTEAGSRIMVGDGTDPRAGSVSITSTDDEAYQATLVELDGTIYAGSAVFDVEDGSMIVGGGIDVVDALNISLTGYFASEATSVIRSQGSIGIETGDDLSLGGLTQSGGGIDLTTLDGAADVTINGAVWADDQVTAYAQGDITLGAEADIQAGLGGSLNFDFVTLDAGGYVITEAGSSIEVTTGFGDVDITAGVDNLGAFGIDLSGDITAFDVDIEATGSSVRLRDGLITTEADFRIESVGSIVMDGPAEIVSDGAVALFADAGISATGRITGENVYLREFGDSTGMTIGGYIYAEQGVFIHDYGAGDAAIVLAAPTIVADSDGTGDGEVVILSNGSVVAPGGGSIRVGSVGGPVTGDVEITANSADRADYAALELDMDIEAVNIYLEAFGGTAYIAGGDIQASGNLGVGALGIDIQSDANLDAGANLYLEATVGISVGADLTAGEDIVIDNGPVGGVEIAAALTAGNDVLIESGLTGVVLDGAVIRSDSDETGGGDILIDTQGTVRGTGSLTAGASAGLVSITAGGSDNGSLAAVSLDVDVAADTLLIDADNGSIHVLGGDLAVVQDLVLSSGFNLLIDEPATVEAGGDIALMAAGRLAVDSDLTAGGDIALTRAGPNTGELRVSGTLAADGSISLVNMGDGQIVLDNASLFADADGDGGANVLIQAQGGVEAFGDGVVRVGGPSDTTGGVTIISFGDDDPMHSIEWGLDIEATDLTLTSDVGSIHLTGGSFAVDSLSIGSSLNFIMDSDASIDSSGSVDITAVNMVIVDGSISSGGGISLETTGATTAGIQIAGDLAAAGSILVTESGSGDVVIGDSATLLADIDGGGEAGIEISAAGGSVVTEAGSFMRVGSQGERTGDIEIFAGGEDASELTQTAIDLSGDMEALNISLTAPEGSVRIRGGILAADDHIGIEAGRFFVLDSSGAVSGDEDGGEGSGGGWPILPSGPAGVTIAASDVHIAGEITAGTSSDPSSIVLVAVDPPGDVVIGGGSPTSNPTDLIGGLQLGDGFFLSNAEFQNLGAGTIVIASGYGAPLGPSYDMIVDDLNINGAVVDNLWLGSAQTISVVGTVTPSGPVNLRLGFVIPYDSGEIDLIPASILISGSLGSIENPFGSVQMLARGDILMGTEEFIAAAQGDPEFDAFAASKEFDPPSEGHIFIAADSLQMGSTGRILQQNTGSGVEFAGLAIGAPTEESPLIIAPQELEFGSGPTRIELFGVMRGSDGEVISGRDVAGVHFLLQSDLEVGDYYINTCLFGSIVQCAQGGDTPIFQNPFPPVDPDVVVDVVLTGLTFIEPDDEEDDDDPLSEPVTGAGNEDLWSAGGGN